MSESQREKREKVKKARKVISTKIANPFTSLAFIRTWNQEGSRLWLGWTAL